MHNSSTYGWKTVRVFISSTFRDFHAERNYLLKWVFPEIREWCRQYKLHFVDIDLRWGITEEQANSGAVIDLCLKEIDGSFPFFLCMLGSRYGWTPEHHEIPEDTRAKYSELFKNKQDLSVTNMEIHYSLLKKVLDNEISEETALFYFRDEMPDPDTFPEFSEEESEVYKTTYFDREAWKKEALSTLKADIRSHYSNEELARNHIFNYSPVYNAGAENPEDPDLPGRIESDSLKAFGAHIIEHLKRVISNRYRERIDAFKKGDEKGAESDLHDYFAEERSISFLGREKELSYLYNYLLGETSSALVVTGEAGTGKSALMSYQYKHVQEDEPFSEHISCAHFVGASAASTSVFSMLKRSCLHMYEEELEEQKNTLIAAIDAEIEELLNSKGLSKEDEAVKKLKEKRIATEKDYEIPQVYSEVEATFKKFLSKLEKKHIIIIDAVNQLDIDENNYFNWIPYALPVNVKIIISCIEGRHAEVIRAKTENKLALETLNEKETLEIIRAVPSIFAKTLDDQHIQALLAKENSRNPLYLNIVLEELRLFGSFDLLEEKITKLPDDSEALFVQVIERLEQDFSPEIIEAVFCLIECSRSGLTEVELRALLFGMDSEERLMIILRHLRTYLIYRDDLVDFFHGVISRAVQRKYLSEAGAAEKWHRLLADYFYYASYIKDESHNRRKLFEMPYQLAAAEEYEKLNETLCDVDYLYLCIHNYGIREILDRFDSNEAANETSELLHACLSFSEHILASSPEQLAAQIANRINRKDAAIAKEYLQKLRDVYPRPYIEDSGYCLREARTSPVIPQRYHTSRILKFVRIDTHQLLVSTDILGRVVFWDVRKMHVILISDEHKYMSFACKSDDDSQLITYDIGGKIIFWDVSVVPMIKNVMSVEKNEFLRTGIEGFQGASYFAGSSILSYFVVGGRICYELNTITGEMRHITYCNGELLESDTSKRSDHPHCEDLRFMIPFRKDGSKVCCWGDNIVIHKTSSGLDYDRLPLLSDWKYMEVVNDRYLFLLNKMGILHRVDMVTLELEKYQITDKNIYNAFFLDPETIVFQIENASTLMLWKRNATAEELHMQNDVGSCCKLPDGELLLGLYNGEVLLLKDNLRSTELQHKSINIALSLDGNKALSIDEDGGVFCHKLEKEHEITNELFGDEVAVSLAISTNGIGALGLDNGNMALWDTHSDEVEEFEFTGAEISACSFSQEDKYLAAGDIYGEVAVMNLNEAEIFGAKLHTSSVRLLSIIDKNDSSNLISSSWGGVERYHILKNKLIKGFYSNSGSILGMIDSGEIFIQHADPELVLIDSMFQEELCNYASEQKSILGVKTSGNILCAWSEYMVEIWDLISTEKLGAISTDYPIQQLDFAEGEIAMVLSTGYLSFARLQNMEKKSSVSEKFEKVRAFFMEAENPSQAYTMKHISLATSEMKLKSKDGLFSIWNEAINDEISHHTQIRETWELLTKVEKYFCTRNTPYRYNIITY